MKKVFKVLGYTFLFLIGFVLLYLLSAYALSRITVQATDVPPKNIAIYIKTNGVHTDIVVPVKNEQYDWSKEIKFANTAAQDSTMQYLAMGWGDKGFYLQTPEWSDLKFSVAFNAMFGLSTTAIHATFYHAMREDTSCRKIMISRASYVQLIEYVNNSLEKDANGHAIKINTDANYGNDDAFYEATGSYSMFTTCNTWANSALKACGQKACLWTAFDTGIFLKY